MSALEEFFDRKRIDDAKHLENGAAALHAALGFDLLLRNDQDIQAFAKRLKIKPDAPDLCQQLRKKVFAAWREVHQGGKAAWFTKILCAQLPEDEQTQVAEAA